MVTAVSNSTTNLLTAKTGIGGLVSGMNTDELVQGLTLGTRTKISQQGQKVQGLEWKQTAYRTVSKALNEFQSKYLDVLAKTNMRSTSFYNTVQATSPSTKIAVTSASSGNEGAITIGAITQLATNQVFQSKVPVTNLMTGKMESVTPGIMTATDVTALLDKIEGKSIKLTLDGKVKTVTFDTAFMTSARANLSSGGLQSAFQTAVDTAFGANAVQLTVTADQLGFTASGSQLTVNALNGDTTTLGFLGIKDGQSNKLDTSKSLGDLAFATSLESGVDLFKTTINGVKFEFNKTDALSTVMSKINSSDAGVNMSYSSISDKFTMTAKNSGAGENIVFSEEQGNLLVSMGLTLGTGETIPQGQNAKLIVNNVEITRSSNDIEVDGVKISLLETTAAPISISMKQNASALLEPIKSFVADYNAMIDLVNGLVKEDADSAYKPLTDTQRETMSEKQIETWETKAKVGLLSGDNLLRGIASKMQTMMYGSAVKGGISLYDLGITSAGYNENGKLVVDETKLKAALETKGSAIKELFTTEGTGLASSLNNIITEATKTTGGQGHRGFLIEMAGYESTMSNTENNITKNIDFENKAKTKLETRLKAEETRLWAQFTAMETALSRLNAQSAMLTSFSAG
ncbi:MAG: flagellar filament capping protein FliD [Eubacteriaceae bacterium]|nr:flagellar filament capping protein FliD [Eubacteriaceae bacterium]